MYLVIFTQSGVIYKDAKWIFKIYSMTHVSFPFVFLMRLAWKGLRREKRGEAPVRPIRRIRGPVKRGPAIKQLTGAVADISSITLLEHEGKHNFLLCSLFVSCAFSGSSYLLFCFSSRIILGNPSLSHRLTWTTIFFSFMYVFVSFDPVCCVSRILGT